jgi:PAS domain S-box-containing protein
LAEKYRRDDLVVMASGVQTRVEEMLATRLGAPRWIETIKTPVYDRHGELIGTTGVARDIMARKRTEMALQESEERFHTIFDQSDDAIILFTLCNIEVMDANPAALQLFGYGRDELLAQPPDQLIAREAFERLIGEMRANEAANTFQIDAHGMRRDGEQLSIVIRARILRLREEYVVHCSIRDIGEKLRLEEEIRATQAKLIQTNKMTSLGMLSSSVAHEINNPNNCISVNASMLSEVWRDTDTILKRFHAENGEFNLRGVPYPQMQQVIPRLFNGVIEGSRRIGMIINNMKDFVREDKRGHDRDLDINKLIQSAASILWHKIHKYTDNFVMDLDEELLPARGNAQQIEQVIINLIMNALQALPDMDKEVCVRTACDRGSGEIVITVRDEGEGMAESVMARLREPFFSTRLDKGGTGLGLYISDSIIKEHKGTLEFASELGKGTVATIKLPVT